MSRKIRMKFSYNGTRWIGGPPWPPYNGILECSDEEAAKYVAIGNAVYLEDEPEAVHEGFGPLRQFSDSYDPELEAATQRAQDDELTEYEADERDEAEDEGPKRPATYAKKEEWVKYAVANGEPQETAERMSKADLISKYGASL